MKETTMNEGHKMLNIGKEDKEHLSSSHIFRTTSKNMTCERYLEDGERCMKSSYQEK